MRRSKEDADATRAAILDAAEQLFANQGIARTRLEDIAKQASVTRGAIYWHFKNKDEIIDAMIDRVITPAEAAVEALVSHQSELSVSTEKLKEVILEAFRNLRAGGSAQQVTRFMLRYSLCAETPSIQEKLEHERRADIDRLRRFMAEAQALCLVRKDIPAEALAIHLRAQIIGIFHQYLSNPDSYIKDSAVKLSLDLIFEALTPR